METSRDWLPNDSFNLYSAQRSRCWWRKDKNMMEDPILAENNILEKGCCLMKNAVTRRMMALIRVTITSLLFSLPVYGFDAGKEVTGDLIQEGSLTRFSEVPLTRQCRCYSCSFDSLSWSWFLVLWFHTSCCQYLIWHMISRVSS